MINSNKDLKLAIIGLGYVGLPLALEFAKYRPIIGFDTNLKRIKELNSGRDKNLEFSKAQLNNAKNLKITNNKKHLKALNCFIVTVPTPLDKFKRPDLNPLKLASKMIGKIIKKNDLIIYESTVYPGCVEEVCVPILEKFSKLNYNTDFFCGYSPERINPGDKKHVISNVKKITSGSKPEIATIVDNLYNEIIIAGTHKVSNIRVAEAAKVIENTQRDLNIALINELSILFSKLNIDTKEVLDAAATKWNFLPFKPGLVGGHCIGVDPYYLTYKAKSIGYKTRIILAGRDINDSMGKHISFVLFKEMKKKKIIIEGSKILVMGLTFKENCADIRNSGVISLINQLQKKNCEIDVYDPWVFDQKEALNKYCIYPITKLNKNLYDAIVIAVAHEKFKKMGIKIIKSLCKRKNIIFDLKHLFPKNQVDIRL